MQGKFELPSLKHDDYLKQDAKFWKKYRQTLFTIMKEETTQMEKTPENIIMLAERIGIKPTARYFRIEPASVRYYIKKIRNGN